MEVSEKDIETLRRSVGHHHLLCVRSDEAPYCSCGRDESLAILDRLSPPAPEVDEATVWTRKVLMARAGGFSSDTEWQSAAVCQVLSELIASKDAEIELERGRFKIADEEVDNLRRELVAVRAEKADFLWRRRAEKAESELATLQAENERLKADNMPPEGYKNLYIAARDCIFDANKLGRIEDGWLLLENVNVLVTSKAAERNTAEPEHCLSGEPHRKAGEVVRSAGLHSSDGSGNTAEPATEMTPDVVVTQADCQREQWARNIASYTEGQARNHVYECAINLLTEAEARGRREALEEIKKWLRSPEGKGSDAGIDYADGFADQIERWKPSLDHLRQPEKGSTDE